MDECKFLLFSQWPGYQKELKWDSSFSAVTNNPTQKIWYPYFHWYFYFLKHISLNALRLKWILDIIWPFNQHFNLKNQRNWIKQVLIIKFWSGINCILLHWQKKLTLVIKILQFVKIAIVFPLLWIWVMWLNSQR